MQLKTQITNENFGMCFMEVIYRIQQFISEPTLYFRKVCINIQGTCKAMRYIAEVYAQIVIHTRQPITQRTHA